MDYHRGVASEYNPIKIKCYFAGCGSRFSSGIVRRNHNWRVRLVVQICAGTVLLTDGEISLDSRSYLGTIYGGE